MEKEEKQFICIYCSLSCSTKSNLLKHQRTIKCIKAQNKFKCKGCLVVFESEEILKTHKERCIDYVKLNCEEIIKLIKFNCNETISVIKLDYDETIISLNENNEKLNEKIKNLENELLISNTKIINLEAIINFLSKTNNINNVTTTINNNKQKNKSKCTTNIKIKLENLNVDTIEPFVKESIEMHLKQGHYTKELYMKRRKGIVIFIKSIIIKNDEKSYVCGDKTRNSFRRLIGKVLNEEEKEQGLCREWHKDSDAVFLLEVFSYIFPYVESYYMEETNAITNNQKKHFDDPKIDNQTYKNYEKQHKEATTFLNNIRKPKRESPFFKKIREDIKYLVII